MNKILIINSGQKFAHSGGKLNDTITEWDKNFFTPENSFEIQITNVSEPYEVSAEIDKFLWADIIVYHFPIWWMYIPFTLKEYLDKVLTAGHKKLYYSDGRKAENPAINYGKGGLLQGKKYMTTTTWNAPETAFTLPDEFFQHRNVDEGVLFPFHRMNAFLSLEQLPSFHFHDVEKNMSQKRLNNLEKEYSTHLQKTFKQNI